MVLIDICINKIVEKDSFSDKYNFDRIRSISFDDKTGAATLSPSIGNLANDLGWAMSQINMMQEYDFSVTYIYDINEDGGIAS